MTNAKPSPEILFVIAGLSAGGSERVVSTLANHWQNQGLGVALVTLAGGVSDHYPLDPGIRRIRLNLTWDSSNPIHGLISNLRRLWVIRRAIRGCSPEVVISFIDQTNVRVLLALIGSRIPILVSERVDPRMYSIGRGLHLLRKIVYRFARAVVVQTEDVAEWARQLVPPNRVAVIPNPLARLPAPAPYETREQLIVAMGRLVPQKGFDLLIPAFAESTAGKQRWRLIILGDGEQRDHLTRLVTAHGMQAQITLAGVVNDPADWLNRAKIFVLTSRFEGFPNALCEAMAMECASIATRCPSGPADLITHGENGILVPVEDLDALTAALNELVTDSDLAARLAGNASRVRTTLATETIAAQWQTLIARCVRTEN